MQALILAGGKGTRLRPYTTVLPKPLMPVGDYPILAIILRQLARAEIREVVLAVGYMSHLFQAVCQDGSQYGVTLTYSVEEQALGTAGPIALALDKLDDDFLVMNGDLLTTLDYRRLLAFHREAKAAATIALHRREVKIDFGVVETDERGVLRRYIEKPTYHFAVSIGVNVFNKAAVAPYLSKDTPIDIPDVMTRLQQDGRAVHTFEEPCSWLDIGRVDDYERATEIFESRRAEFLPE